MNSPREPLVPPPTPRPAATVMLVRDGFLAVARTTPDPARLQALGAPPQRRQWWIDRVVAEPAAPVDGFLAVARTTPDPARLQALGAPPQRRQWWIDRVKACYSLLVPSFG